MSGLLDWIRDYIRALPPGIRPGEDDSRFVRAAQQARASGWTPEQAAHRIGTASYGGADNPPLVAIAKLEKAAAEPPTTPVGWSRARCHVCGRPPDGGGHQCLACPPRAHCCRPVTDRIPARWTGERMALIRLLTATPGLTEDEREQQMVDLIRRQKESA